MMVGPLVLLKLLHCNKRCQNPRKNESIRTQGTSSDSNSRELVLKKEVEDTQNTCRVCLKDGFIPIYGQNVIDDIPEALNTFGGVQVTEADAYPKFLCESCHALLQGAILFRKTAQQSDLLLTKRIEVSIDYDESSNGTNNDNAFDCDAAKETEYISKPRNFNCKKCNLEFETFKEYSEHRLTEDHENRRLTCPVCNNSYAALYFKKHLAVHNRSEAPYMCDICGKKFIVQGQFKRHRLTHFYELPFKCSLCPYRGRFSESLKMHMRTHTGEKPYQCSECAAQFVSKSNLNKHMNTHKGEHDYKCETCGRGFYSKRNLEMHIKVDHTGIREHVCPVCGKAFGYRKQMMKHQLKVHKRQKLKSGRLPLYLQVDKMGQGSET